LEQTNIKKLFTLLFSSIILLQLSGCVGYEVSGDNVYNDYNYPYYGYNYGYGYGGYYGHYDDDRFDGDGDFDRPNRPDRPNLPIDRPINRPIDRPINRPPSIGRR